MDSNKEAGEPRRLVTGIKAVDLFAPMAYAAITHLAWRRQTGATVLITELVHRFRTFEHGRVVLVGFLDTDELIRELCGEFAECGLSDCIENELFTSQPSSAVQREMLDAALKATSIVDDQQPSVLLVVFQSGLSKPWFDSILHQFISSSRRDSTLILSVTNFGQTSHSTEPLLLHKSISSNLALQPARAKAGIYPPIDPLACSTSLIDDPDIDPRNETLKTATRDAFAAYADYDPELRNLGSNLSANSAPDDDVGKLLELFKLFGQPMYVAAPFTGIAGTWVSPSATLDELEMLFRGDG